MHLRILISIIFAFSFFVFSFPVFAQSPSVIQCTPGVATIRKNLQVGINADPGNLTVSGNSYFQSAYFGSNGSRPYIKDNSGAGLLFYSQGGQNFLWQSGSGNPGADAMILGGTAANFLPTDNGFYLQVYGNLCLTDGCRSTWPSGGSGNWTLSGVNIYNNNTGNVGIGTTGPQVPLHVNSTITAPSSTGVPNGSILVGGTTTGVQMAMGVTADVTPQYGWIQSRYSNNGDVYSLVLNPNGGNVGIGTITPGAKLEVAGQIKITGGAPGAGKVLTSDAVGLASWTDPASGLPTGTAGQTLRHDGTNWAASSALLNGGTNIQIENQIKIAGGAPGAGKVLTSDATGLASWQFPTTGGKRLFTANGTFTVPSGVTQVWVTMSGGGGGGGGSSQDTGSGAKGGGGGGGGNAIKARQVAVTPGNNINVTVGVGGSAGYISQMAVPISSTSGGSSSFGAITVNGGLRGGDGFFPSPNNYGGLGATSGTMGTTSSIPNGSRGGTGGGSIFGSGGLGGGLRDGNGRYGDDGYGYGGGGGGSGYTIFSNGLFYGAGGDGSYGFVLVEW